MALMPQSQREQSLVFVALLAFAAIFAQWYFIYAPKAAELAVQEQRLDTLVALNRKAKAELARGDLSALRAQLAEYRDNLALVRTLVPTGNEVPALLEQVSTAARRVGLDLASVDPEPVVQGDGYETYRYNIAVLGGYHALGKFLTNVGSLTRIVLPVNLTLQMPTNVSAAKSHKKADAAVVEARFQLQTFVVRKQATDDDALPPLKSGAE